jgi:hypothetical protein
MADYYAEQELDRAFGENIETVGVPEDQLWVTQDKREIVIKEMTAFGCTDSFIDAYKWAGEHGATRVLFYV